MNCPLCGRSLSVADQRVCPACAELRERRLALGPAIRSLAAHVAAVEPPADLEPALLVEFDLASRRRRNRVRTRWFAAVGGALAASVLAGAFLVHQQPPGAGPAAARTPSATDTEPFLPIPFTQPLQPYERVLVVETDVPVAELTAAGFRVQTSDPRASIRADVMVSQDGRPRAIRPVSFSVAGRRF